MPLLKLLDHLEEKNYEFEVNQEEMTKVLNGDLMLASRLLEKHKEKQNFVAAFKIMQQKEDARDEESNESMFAEVLDDIELIGFQNTNGELGNESILNDTPLRTEIGAEQKEQVDNNKLWNVNSTKMLISLCKKYDDEFQRGVKKYIWVKIAAQLSEAFKMSYTYQQCDTKFKVLKNMYKSIKKHNEQSGNNKRSWEFYELMHEIMFKKPEINAVATCSSARGLTVSKGVTTPSSGSELLDNTVSPQSEESGEEFQSTVMQKRKRYENATERRHKEKMSRQDKYLSLLERLTVAVEKSTQNNV